MLSRESFVILLLTLTSAYTISDKEFDKFVNYVSDYINFTTNYQFPSNNIEIPSDLKADAKDYGSYDFVIIGAGNAGTILARRLTENKNFTVLLLEAGEAENSFTNIPAMNAYTRTSPFNWGYKTVPQKNSCLGMVDRRCVYPTGKALGRSNVIGDMVYARGNKADFDAWAAQGNKGWSYADVLPYFRKTERDETNDKKHTKKYHGFRGILPINYTSPTTMNYKQFLDANKACGLKETDINGEVQVGIQMMPWTIKGNVRQTGGNAFVKPVLHRPNLNVTLKAFVTKLLIESDSVTGVQFVKDNKLYQVKAVKEVILSAGPINSPQLLMLSGVGPKAELERLDIPVKNDLPVGKYLADQPVYVGMYIRTNQTAPNAPLAEGLKSYLANKRPFNSVFNAQHIAFLNTKKPGQDPPNIEILTINPPMSVPTDLVGFYNLDKEAQKGFSGFNALTDYLVYIIVMKPKSKGNVTLQSKSPKDFPLIDPAYYTDDGTDLQIMYEGVQYVLNMTNTAPLKAIDAKVVATSPACEHLKAQSEKKYWLCAIKQLTSTIYHPTGTTRMGVSKSSSVVNSEFKVHNMKNLRVCDAGAMPEIVSGHPFAAIIMMGEKLADIIKKQYA